MPFVLLRIDQELEHHFIDDPANLQLLRGMIVGVIDPNLDPDDDLDVNIEVRHPAAHSKYRMTIDIEMMETPERVARLDAIAMNLQRAMNVPFGVGKVNVWIKLVQAGYAPS